MISNTSANKSTPAHIVWRWVLLGLLLVGDIGYHVLQNVGASRQLFSASRLSTNLLVYLAAGVMALLTARKFGKGEPSRNIWLVISLTGFSGVITNFANYGPVVIGNFPGVRALYVFGFAISSVSVLLLGWAMWTMVRIYRNTGMKVSFGAGHYIAMALFAGMSVVSVILLPAATQAQNYSGFDELTKWIVIICTPRMFIYPLCSVLGVMLWCYAIKMGGGQVSKAWISMLAYTGLVPLRYILLGVFATVIARTPATAIINGEISYLGFGLSGFLLYLGSSYQYQACTEDVVVYEEEMEQEPALVGA